MKLWAGVFFVFPSQSKKLNFLVNFQCFFHFVPPCDPLCVFGLVMDMQFLLVV